MRSTKVPNTVHLGTHVDETGSSLDVWHINKAHYLESWSDARAYDGTISIVQPMIAPALRRQVGAHDVLQTLLDNPQGSPAMTRCTANAKTYIKGDFANGVAQGAARWLGRRHGIHATRSAAPAAKTASRGSSSHSAFRRRRATFEISASGPILRSTMAATRTSAGCRSCPSR